MGKWKADISRVRANPFPSGDDDLLMRYLQPFADFFEEQIGAEQELYDCWNGVQAMQGDAWTTNLAFAVASVANLQSDMDTIYEVKRYAPDGLVVLFHVGLVELVESSGYRSFQDWLLSNLKDEDYALPVEGSRAAVRRYMKEQKKIYEEGFGAVEGLRRALTYGLNDGEKQQLIQGFMFSKPYDFGTEVPDNRQIRHLFCRELLESERPKKVLVEEYCAEMCPAPGGDELDSFVRRLASKLYQMRSSFVHKSIYEFFAVARERRTGLPEYSGSLQSAWYANGKLNTYLVTHSTPQLCRLLRVCIWRRLWQRGRTTVAATTAI